MRTLTLIDPQPMETLPTEGMVFCDWEKPVSARRSVSYYDVFNVRFMSQAKGHGLFHAWSYTATFAEEQQ